MAKKNKTAQKDVERIIMMHMTATTHRRKVERSRKEYTATEVLDWVTRERAKVNKRKTPSDAPKIEAAIVQLGDMMRHGNFPKNVIYYALDFLDKAKAQITAIEAEEQKKAKAVIDEARALSEEYVISLFDMDYSNFFGFDLFEKQRKRSYTASELIPQLYKTLNDPWGLILESKGVASIFSRVTGLARPSVRFFSGVPHAALLPDIHCSDRAVFICPNLSDPYNETYFVWMRGLWIRGADYRDYQNGFIRQIDFVNRYIRSLQATGICPVDVEPVLVDPQMHFGISKKGLIDLIRKVMQSWGMDKDDIHDILTPPHFHAEPPIYTRSPMTIPHSDEELAEPDNFGLVHPSAAEPESVQEGEAESDVWRPSPRGFHDI